MEPIVAADPGAEQPRKRRRWGAAAPAEAAPAAPQAQAPAASNPEEAARVAAAAAAAAAAAVASLRLPGLVGGGGGGGGVASGLLAGRPFLDIDINDCKTKGALTRKQTHEEVTSQTGASIVIRGRYKPPGDTSTDERPLHLHLEADTQEAIERAEAILRELMGPPPEPAPGYSNGGGTCDPAAAAAAALAGSAATVGGAASGAAGGEPGSGVLHCDVDVGLDVTCTGYQLRGKLLGPRGAYLKHIQERSGCRVQLSGKGCSTVDGGLDTRPLHISISVSDASDA